MKLKKIASFVSLQIIYLVRIQGKNKAFWLKSNTTRKYIGKINNIPKMTDKAHALFFDIRTNDDHESSLCTQERCIYTNDLNHLIFSPTNSTKILIIQNDDDTYSFMFKKNCLVEKKLALAFDECGTDFPDKFIKIFPGEENDKKDDDSDVKDNKSPKSAKEIVFNYGIEDADHRRDSVIKMNREDENYTLVPRNRHHNSHTHRVGGFGDKAYYTYYSYHPSSRHSAYNFHGKHHGIPPTWNEDAPFFNLFG
ncbi:hypothetical protein EDEG_02175 [Edhazardia aedis USNM 41457]|uniref:Uncharacterized protein n=1 Tax=Edhazardia aedis (strain USNM 41457) TaxID=1003232 RepID=J9D7I2_EDHAE|nr:hypothetical protein EDEG_02175 [Edhazardia aedis USNM 41457]|eukprot:EJW03479.1 hypothetical protein EDEG_02175 [Edhazardia aedis USNM 41457]